MNDLFEDDIKNVEPQEELKRIISKVGNEKSLITMCFSILSTKCLLKNLSNDEDGKSISIKKEEKEESPNKEMAQIWENNNQCQERNENKIDLLQIEMIINEKLRFYNNPSIINSSVGRVKIGTHYYKSNEGEIFSYSSKWQKKSIQLTFHCNNWKDKWRARFFIIKSNDHYSLKLNGVHIHEEWLKKEHFYSQYQFLLKENWKHIQKFIDKDIIIAVRLC